MGFYNRNSILDEKCIPVQELTRDNIALYCTEDAIPHKGLIIRWLKTVGVKYGLAGFGKATDPISGKMLGWLEFKEKNGYGWSNVDIYLFEKYNIKMKDSFIQMFEDVSERIAEIKGETRRKKGKAMDDAAQIIISGRSGYVEDDEEYSDTLSITDHSIEYECTPCQPS